MNLSRLSMALLLIAGPTIAVADDLEDAFQSLKKAETEKDAAQVKKLAAETHALALKAIAEPAPQSADEKEAWKAHVAYAKEIDLHTEYSLAATGMQSAPATLIDLISALEAQNPKSKYLDTAYGPYLNALNQSGAGAKVPAAAEKAIANFPENEDLLLILTDHFSRTKQPERAAAYAVRLTNAVNKHPKPEGFPAADWERRRSAMLATGYCVAGLIHGEKGQYALADKELRAALPLIKGDNTRMGAALFVLGIANYQLGKMTNDKKRVLEGASFSDQSAAIAGPYQQQAWRNAQLTKTEAAKMR